MSAYHVYFNLASEDRVDFSLVSAGGLTRTFSLCVHSSFLYNQNTNIPQNTPKSVVKRVYSIFTRYLNWLLVTDTLKASLSGHNSGEPFRKEDILFKHWHYGMYQDIQPIIDSLNLKLGIK